ncbi:TetR family transcriptional regulator [Murinocardiopsis flavida]|uniref:TetR family transcriptional regulator n=1 Tax=Murinocardiopsis flavida TaxID=645275 RepID=A0A2P8DLA8_9ACTN|nr:TetR family transcriptional regulator [Murinocardiopsis flavida]
MPAGLGRLWRLPVGGRLGRPAELDVERVVRTAVDLARRDGLGGVTLAKVAKELGYTPMSLYRHVGSKDELFVLMGDFAYGAAPALDAVPGGWREGLRQWAIAMRAMYAEQPWLTVLPVSGPPSGPNAVDWMDACLRVLRDTGLGWGEKVGIQTVLSGYVRHMALMAQHFTEGIRDAGLEQAQVEQDYGRALAKLVDPGRFPDAAMLFASDLFESPSQHAGDGPLDEEFDFGLALILDGIAAEIERPTRDPA